CTWALGRGLARLAGPGSGWPVSRRAPAVADAGAPIALEAAWRAIVEVARGAVQAVRGRLAGESVTYDPPAGAGQQIEHFLESLSLENTDLGTIGTRLVRLIHAPDHLTHLHDGLTHLPPAVSGEQLPGSFATGARALAALLAVTKDPEASPDPTLFAALEDASERLTADCRAVRQKTLEDVALQRAPAATARAVLETLGWADRALYHAWRLAESLRMASGD